MPKKNDKSDKYENFGFKGSTPEELGLDWEPESVVAQYDFNGSRRKSPNIHLIINNKTGEPLAAASADWKPLGNRKFFDRVKTSLDSIEIGIERGGYIHGARQSLRSGDRCTFLISEDVPALGYALFGDNKEIYHSRLILFNHHHPGFGMGARLQTVRLVCKNGLVANEVKKGIVFSHTESGIKKHQSAIESLFGFEQVTIKLRLEQEALVETKVSDDDAIAFFVNNFGDNKLADNEQPVPVKTMIGIYKNEYQDLKEGVDLSVNEYTEGTAYGILQSVTGYYSHIKAYGSSDSRLRNQLMSAATEAIQGSLVRAFIPRSRQLDIAEQIRVSVSR